jgi:hypothetical protein
MLCAWNRTKTIPTKALTYTLYLHFNEFVHLHRLEAEQMRRLAMKRPYESRGGREEFWAEPKRQAMSDGRFSSNSSFSSDRYNN